MMRSLLLTSLLLSATTTALAKDEAASPCPTLPAKSGLTWKHNAGAAFVVCRALRGDSQVFGVYLGNSPSYNHREEDKAETSMVGTYEATWYNVSPDEKRGVYAREALIRFGEKDIDGVAHIWISAANADEFASALKVLEGVTLRPPVAAAAPAPAPDAAVPTDVPTNAPADVPAEASEELATHEQ